MLDIISFGTATVDIFVKSDSISIEKNLPQDLIYLPKSSKNEMTDSLITSGGGATNTSVSFSKLGLKTSCCALFGHDPLSYYITNDLVKYKVDQNLLVQLKKETTDYSVILVTNDGSRTILTQRGSSSLEKRHIKWSKINSKWFYISSLEGNLNLLEYLIGYALEKNIKIALNPGNRELNHPNLKNLLKYVDFLLLNEIESKTLVGLSFNEPNFGQKLKSFGAKINAVTCGHEGAHIYSQGQTLFSPIINTNPVDETGAGDGFGSAFVAGLVHQKSLYQCLNMAIHNSASVVSFLGAKTGLLKLKDC